MHPKDPNTSQTSDIKNSKLASKQLTPKHQVDKEVDFEKYEKDVERIKA